MNIIRSVAAIAFITLSGLAAAQPVSPSPVTAHERIEVRHDNRNIVRDRHTLQRTHYQLHRAQRTHDYRRVSKIRHSMHRERMELRHDRFEHRHDVSNLHRG